MQSYEKFSYPYVTVYEEIIHLEQISFDQNYKNNLKIRKYDNMCFQNNFFID